MLHKFIKFISAILLSIAFLLPVDALNTVRVDVDYQGQENGNWTDFAYGGALSSTENGVALDNLEIHLVNAPYGANIEYRVYINESLKPWVLGLKMPIPMDMIS